MMYKNTKYINFFFIIWFYFIFKHLNSFVNNVKCSELYDVIIGSYPIKVYGYTNYFIINELLSPIKLNIFHTDVYFYTYKNGMVFPKKHPLSHPHLILSQYRYKSELFHLGLQFSSYNYNNNFTLLSSYNLSHLPYNQYISMHFRIINNYNLYYNNYNINHNPLYNDFLKKPEIQQIYNNLIINNLKKHKIF